MKRGTVCTTRGRMENPQRVHLCRSTHVTAITTHRYSTLITSYRFLSQTENPSLHKSTTFLYGICGFSLHYSLLLPNTLLESCRKSTGDTKKGKAFKLWCSRPTRGNFQSLWLIDLYLEKLAQGLKKVTGQMYSVKPTKLIYSRFGCINLLRPSKVKTTS